MKRFKKILCVVEAGAASNPALERAVILAESNQASLTVIDVVEHLQTGIRKPMAGSEVADMEAVLVREHAQALKSLVEPFPTRADIKTRVLTGVPFLEIIREVLRNGHDLIIKTPQTMDWLDRLFGSNDMHLLRKCPCPVWLIKPETKASWHRILAAVDVDDVYLSDESETRLAQNRQILEMAGSLALSDFSELHIGHAWDAVCEGFMRGRMGASEKQVVAYVEEVKRQHKDNLKDLIAEVTGHLGQDAVNYLKPQTHLVKGWARQEIPALAKKIDADLVVMGTVGRTGIPGFIMGNTAETILDQINCSVLAIKPPGFITPVTLEE